MLIIDLDSWHVSRFNWISSWVHVLLPIDIYMLMMASSYIYCLSMNICWWWTWIAGQSPAAPGRHGESMIYYCPSISICWWWTWIAAQPVHHGESIRYRLINYIYKSISPAVDTHTKNPKPYVCPHPGCGIRTDRRRKLVTHLQSRKHNRELLLFFLAIVHNIWRPYFQHVKPLSQEVNVIHAPLFFYMLMIEIAFTRTSM